MRSWSLARITTVGGQSRILPSRLSRRRYPFSNVVFRMLKHFSHLIMPQATLRSQSTHYGQSKWTWATAASNHRCGLRLTATGLFKKCVFHPHIRHFYMGSLRASRSFPRTVVFGNLGSNLNARIKKTICAKMERPAAHAMLWQVNQISKPNAACWRNYL